MSEISEYRLGIDDTDSNKGMCTTYLGTLFVDVLLKKEVNFLDFPRLIRLNPNIPYKTRGNGAVSFHFQCKDSNMKSLWNELIKLVDNYSNIEDENTHPGMVLLKGNLPSFFPNLYYEALHDLISLEFVKSYLKFDSNVTYYFLKEGRGLIGASSAIGAKIDSDYTFELIAYRIKDNYGIKKRNIDLKSVEAADKAVPLSFNNIDYINNSIMITPHGPDPILCGIRGETSNAVIKMWNMLKIQEPIESLMLFRTNQHTNAHLTKTYQGDEIKPYLALVATGVVFSKPSYIKGGHVIFSLKIGEKVYDCAAYEPTKKFRNIIIELNIGDIITVYGGVRKLENTNTLTINLEEIQINSLKETIDRKPPKCPLCQSTLKSAGKKSGFKCKRCSFKTKEKDFILLPKTRRIRTGVRYVTPICAQRHLTKPVSRDINLQFFVDKSTNYSADFYSFLKQRHDLSKRAFYS